MGMQNESEIIDRSCCHAAITTFPSSSHQLMELAEHKGMDAIFSLPRNVTASEQALTTVSFGTMGHLGHLE